MASNRPALAHSDVSFLPRPGPNAVPLPRGYRMNGFLHELIFTAFAGMIRWDRSSWLDVLPRPFRFMPAFPPSGKASTGPGLASPLRPGGFAMRLAAGLAFTLALPGMPDVAVAARPVEAQAERPSFLFLFADDQRADTISAWGNRHIQTPHLDRLARAGTSFKANYCAGSNNGAVCIPSRAMLMGGRSWRRVGPGLENVVTFPEWLGQHGYQTFATGKWHNGQKSLTRSFQSGRALFLGGMSDHTRTPVVDLDGGIVSAPRTASAYSSEAFADAAIQFLRSAEPGRPFLCYVAFTAPHDPRNPPTNAVLPYYRKRPPLPPNFLPQHPFDNGWMRNLRDEDLAPYPRTPDVIRDQLAEYYGLITHLDQQVGRIMAALATSPQARNTVVVYAADHGLALGSHGLLGKQSLYEHSMRCPLILAGPGIPKGRSIHGFTYLLDLFPTLCDLANLPAPAGLEGRSLRPLWSPAAATGPWRDSVFLAFTDTMRSFRDERWKLIVYPPTGRRQLFDLRRDPHERRNLAGSPGHRAREEALLARMREAQERDGDPLPLSSEAARPSSIDLSHGYRRNPDKEQPAWIVEKYFGR